MNSKPFEKLAAKLAEQREGKCIAQLETTLVGTDNKVNYCRAEKFGI